MSNDSSQSSSDSEEKSKSITPPCTAVNQNSNHPPKKHKRSPVSVCLINCRYDVIKKIVKKFEYKEAAELENWNFYWTDWSISVERCKEMKRFQKINHFPGMLEICRKDLLARNLNRMQRIFPKEYDYFPKTWCLPADMGDALAYSRVRKNKTYILKPNAGNQGRGIVLCKSLKDINPSERLICQVYLSRPFLIDGFKFDLRVYCLITSCDPLRIYVYKEGLVRFATSRYKEPSNINISNVFMHLTNYAVNKHSRTYNQDNEGGSKRKLTWFSAYLRNLGYDVDRLWKSIDEIVVKTVISAAPILKHSYLACFPNHDVIPACCELLGIDILLDKKLNPLLLEVNHSPSFHTETELDNEVKDALISDMFRMVNLESCDKRKILRQDRRKVRERLQGLTGKDNPNHPNPDFTNYYKHEMANRGNFKLVYPTNDHYYDKFYQQGVSSIFSTTQSTKARANAQILMREEMITKAKIEAEKRVTNLKPPNKIPKQLPASPTETAKILKIKTEVKNSSDIILNSFEPRLIVESEENERLERLSQKDFLVRNNGLFEHVYYSMKINGALRPQDVKKYSLFERVRRSQDGPAISDLLEGIRCTIPPPVISNDVER